MSAIDLSALELRNDDRGTILPVRAQPKARRNGLSGVHDGALKVQVTAVPEKGKANKAIIRLLADMLNTNASAVALLSGETSSRKTFLIDGMRPEAIRRLLEQAMA